MRQQPLRSHGHRLIREGVRQTAVSFVVDEISDVPYQAAPPSPAIEHFFATEYEGLRRVAHARLRRSESVTLLDTTSLVHECYLRFLQAGQGSLAQPAEFVAYASRVMRSIIVDFIRRRRAERRGGDAEHISLDATAAQAVRDPEQEILEVSEALDLLAACEPRLAQVVEMRYFGGLTEPEIAQCLGVTDRTVRRDWEKARQLLRVAMTPST